MAGQLAAPHGAGAAGAHREPLLLGGSRYIGNVLYGVAKAATDKLTADMTHGLRRHGVTAVSLYPGLVRTEAVLAAGVFDLSNSGSPQFIGRAVAALAGDPEMLRWSVQVVVQPRWPESTGSQTSTAASLARSRWPMSDRPRWAWPPNARRRDRRRTQCSLQVGRCGTPTVVFGHEHGLAGHRSPAWLSGSRHADVCL